MTREEAASGVRYNGKMTKKQAASRLSDLVENSDDVYLKPWEREAIYMAIDALEGADE